MARRWPFRTLVSVPPPVDPQFFDPDYLARQPGAPSGEIHDPHTRYDANAQETNR